MSQIESVDPDDDPLDYLEEIARSYAMWSDDERMGYVEVQISRPTWQLMQAWLKRRDAERQAHAAAVHRISQVEDALHRLDDELASIEAWLDTLPGQHAGPTRLRAAREALRVLREALAATHRDGGNVVE